GAARERSAASDQRCLFCSSWGTPAGDDTNLVAHRADDVLVMLNLYPYNGGHVMVVPRQHAGALPDIPPFERASMMEAATRACRAISDLWQPHGFNLGLNIGSAAGAGIPEHVHLHIVPRWRGDTNFMSTVGGTRVISQDLQQAHRQLAEAMHRPRGPHS
ncbi:MAG: HIT domain-containing protein, partial [Acidobacteriota bacterium]